MNGITTHILDTNRGRPADNVKVQLEKLENNSWTKVGDGITDSDGRVSSLTTDLTEGDYRLTFFTKEYFEKLKQETFYPMVNLTFFVKDASEHYHVPLLLNGHGYTTYRGS